MKLKKIVLRLGTENLLSIIGIEVFNLLKLRGKANLNSKNLTDIIFNIYSEKDLLKNKNFREMFFNAFDKREISLIGSAFNIPQKNPWEEIKKINFDKKNNMDFLMKIFEIKDQTISFSETTNSNNPIQINPSYSLFEHQINVLFEIEKLLKKSTKRALLHMPTGSGKTRTAMNLICNHFKNNDVKNNLVIWLAHTEELCQQAHDEFSNAWSNIGNKEIFSYKLFKNFRYDITKIKSGFAVISLDFAYSLIKKKQGEFFKLAANCNFVIMDEAHMAIAPSYKQILEIIATKGTSLLGLSATPGRSHMLKGEDTELANFFYKQKATLKIEKYKNPIKWLQDKGFLSNVKTEDLISNININKIFSKKEIKNEIVRIKDGKDLSQNFIKKIDSDEKRINMIIEKIIIESKNEKNKIIVFASSVATAKKIYTILKFEGILSACITQETNLIERRNSIESFKNEKSNLNIIINYGVLTTGFDAPKANVAIIGRPTQSVTLYSQMVGRVTRGPKAEGTKECKIITVKDKLPGFRDISESFFYWEEIWE